LCAKIPLRWFIRAVVERTVRPPDVKRGAGCGGEGEGECGGGGGGVLASAFAFLSADERAEVGVEVDCELLVRGLEGWFGVFVLLAMEVVVG
jgi:hypothetical protein